MVKLLFLLALGAVHFPISVTGCTVSSSQIKAFYGTGDGFWRIQLGWSSDNIDCKVHLQEQVDDEEKFQIVESKECKKGKYCYFKTSKQCCSNGIMQYKSMKFSTECSCNVASFTFTIQSLLSGNSSRDCKYIIPPGKNRRENVDNMEFRECGKPCPLVKIPRECPAVGCFCMAGYMLNTTTGKCYKEQCPEKPEKCGLTLVTPECVKWSEQIVISWDAEKNWKYTYTISSSSTIIRQTVQSDSTEGFTVTGENGQLTIPGNAARALRPDNYAIKVVAITSAKNCSGNGSFSIKIGCKPPLPLDIDGEGMCLQRFSYLLISWKVEEDRTYKYSISEEGTVVKDHSEVTVPGSGSDGFPVDNGGGQVTLKLEPGDYTVTVQDLDAGVKNYYTKSKDFSVKACNFEIETSNCVEKGQTVTVSLLAFSDRTYEFSVLVENTGQAVLNGSFLSGMSQNGVMATYNLDSSDSLPVGRYGVLIREVETGGEGYGRFGINSYGNISADVKYRADPLPDGLYVCLDPREGRLFSSGLTYKINDGIESSLHGLGMCLEEAYGGGQGTLEISIKKDGTIAGTVDIDYVG